MSSIDIYGIPDSAPCRILYMTCEAIGISYNSIICDLFKKENWTDQYLKVSFLLLIYFSYQGPAAHVVNDFR